MQEFDFRHPRALQDRPRRAADMYMIDLNIAHNRQCHYNKMNSRKNITKI
jgi:hypothetical protein